MIVLNKTIVEGRLLSGNTVLASTLTFSFVPQSVLHLSLRQRNLFLARHPPVPLRRACQHVPNLAVRNDSMIWSWLKAALKCATVTVIRGVPGAAAALTHQSRALVNGPKSMTSPCPPSVQRSVLMCVPWSARTGAAVPAP